MNAVPGACTPLAEFIAVVGPRGVGSPARVLGVFPDAHAGAPKRPVPLPAGLEIFALPDGAACVLGAAAPPPPRLYMVVLSASSAKLYVYCLLVHEPLADEADGAEPPSAPGTPAAAPPGAGGPRARNWAPRCVVLVSRHACAGPALYLEALSAQLDALLREPPAARRGDRRRARRARKAALQAAGPRTSALANAPVPASCPPEAEAGRAVEHFLFRTVRQRLSGLLPPEIPLPTDGAAVSVVVGARTLAIALHPSSAAFDAPSPNAPLPFHPGALLARAPAELLCTLLEALLCEVTVVLVSDSAAVLCAAAELLASLLRPFAWQGAYVPVLPEPLVEVVFAPVPSLVGVLGPLFDEAVAPELGIDTSFPAKTAGGVGGFTSLPAGGLGGFTSAELGGFTSAELGLPLPQLPREGGGAPDGDGPPPLVCDLRPGGRRLLHGYAPPARLPERIRASIATAARACARLAPLGPCAHGDELRAAAAPAVPVGEGAGAAPRAQPGASKSARKRARAAAERAEQGARAAAATAEGTPGGDRAQPAAVAPPGGRRTCALLELLAGSPSASAASSGLGTVLATQLHALVPGVRAWARGTVRALSNGTFNPAAFAALVPAGAHRAFVAELARTQLFSRMAAELAVEPLSSSAPAPAGSAAPGGGAAADAADADADADAPGGEAGRGAGVRREAEGASDAVAAPPAAAEEPRARVVVAAGAPGGAASASAGAPGSAPTAKDALSSSSSAAVTIVKNVRKPSMTASFEAFLNSLRASLTSTTQPAPSAPPASAVTHTPHALPTPSGAQLGALPALSPLRRARAASGPAGSEAAGAGALASAAAGGRQRGAAPPVLPLWVASGRAQSMPAAPAPSLVAAAQARPLPVHEGAPAAREPTVAEGSGEREAAAGARGGAEDGDGPPAAAPGAEAAQRAAAEPGAALPEETAGASSPAPPASAPVPSAEKPASSAAALSAAAAAPSAAAAAVATGAARAAEAAAAPSPSAAFAEAERAQAAAAAEATAAAAEAAPAEATAEAAAAAEAAATDERLALAAGFLVSAYEQAAQGATRRLALRLRRAAGASRAAHARLLRPTAEQLKVAVGAYATAAVAVSRAPARAERHAGSRETEEDASSAATWGAPSAHGRLRGMDGAPALAAESGGRGAGSAQGGAASGGSLGGGGGDSGSPGRALAARKARRAAAQSASAEAASAGASSPARAAAAGAPAAGPAGAAVPTALALGRPAPIALPPSAAADARAPQPRRAASPQPAGVAPPPSPLEAADGASTMGQRGAHSHGWRRRRLLAASRAQLDQMEDAREQFRAVVREALAALRDGAGAGALDKGGAEGVAPAEAAAPAGAACAQPLRAFVAALRALAPPPGPPAGDGVADGEAPPPTAAARAVELVLRGLRDALAAGERDVGAACEEHARERWSQLAAARAALEGELFALRTHGATPELRSFVARQEAHSELRAALSASVHAPIAAAVDEGAREGEELVVALGALLSEVQGELLAALAHGGGGGERAPREQSRCAAARAEPAA